VRVAADTNVVVSAFLWGGPPRQVLEAARQRRIELFTSAALFAELEEILQRDKFRMRFEAVGLTFTWVLERYLALARFVVPASTPRVVLDDPDDDCVIAAAQAAEAERIVSGDRHLLELRSYENIRIVSAADLVVEIMTLGQTP